MNLNKLIQLADGATPGPWKKVDDHGILAIIGPPSLKRPYNSLAIDFDAPDASFVAAANPTTVKRMAELLVQCREALKCQTPDYEFRLDEALAALDAFEKELE